MSSPASRRRRFRAAATVATTKEARLLSDQCLRLVADKVAKHTEVTGRAFTTRSDPSYTWTQAVFDAERVIDAAGVATWVEDRIDATRKGPGRPAELSARTFMVSSIAFALKGDGDFHLRDLWCAMVSQIPAVTRVKLGIDNVDRAGRPRPCTEKMVRGAAKRLAKAFDAEAASQTAGQREVNFNHRLELVRRVLGATLPEESYTDGYALDGTFIAAFYQPSRRVRRRWRDADGGRMRETVPVDIRDEGAVLIDPHTGRPARGRGKSTAAALPSLDPDAGWHVRENDYKYGYNLLPIVRSGAGHPGLIEHLLLSSGNGSEFRHAVRLLEDFSAHRAADPALAGSGTDERIGDLHVDMGFTQYPVFLLRARQLGARPVFDLKKNQQQAKPKTFEDGTTAWNKAGHTYCSCVPEDFRDSGAPKWRLHDYEGEARHRKLVERAESFRFKPNGRKPGSRNGSWAHFTPHFTSDRRDGYPGGCDHCTNPDGSAVLRNGRPVPRCCTQKLRQLLPDDYLLRQQAIYGSAAWYESKKRRNVSEGWNGTLKDVSNIEHKLSIRLRGLATFTLVALFTAVALNINAMRNWSAQAAKGERLAADDTGRSTVTRRGPTMPLDVAQPSRAAPPRRAGPKKSGSTRHAKGFRINFS